VFNKINSLFISLKKISNLITQATKFKIYAILLAFLDKVGINAIFRTINKKKLAILMFHGISKKNFSYSHKRLIPKKLFEEILKYLKKKNYIFITLSDWLKIVKRQINHNYIILTFDDGFKNIIENAYPIMLKYGAKGCFYVVSSLIGNYQLLLSDYLEVLVRNHNNSIFKFVFKNKEIIYPLNSEQQIRKAYGDIKVKLRNLPNKEKISHLKQFPFSNNISNFQKVPKDYLISNWEELSSLNKNILEIGCHTKTHPLLEMLNSEIELNEELYQSKLEIEKKIGYSIYHLCYPAGSYNKSVIQSAGKYGYRTGVTVEEGFNSINSDLFQLKRLKINNDFLMFKFKISGFYYFIKNIFQNLILKQK